MTQTSIENKIKDRFNSLIKIADELINKIKSPNIKINYAILYNCVVSWYYDLTRTKTFHQIEFADSHKRAAFIIKWISKLKPLQLDYHKEHPQVELLVNEAFALIAGLTHLNISIKDIPRNLIKNIMYTLHYRDIEGMTYSCTMYLLEQYIISIIELNKVKDIVTNTPESPS